MNIAYSGITGLSIIAIEEVLVIVDNNLEVYDKISVDSFCVEPKDIMRAFIKATKRYFKDFMFKQFEVLAYKNFANSEFVKQLIEEAKNND